MGARLVIDPDSLQRVAVIMELSDFVLKKKGLFIHLILVVRHVILSFLRLVHTNSAQARAVFEVDSHKRPAIRVAAAYK